MTTNTHAAQSAGERSRIRRHPDRSVSAEASTILAEGAVAHVGFVQDGQPYVIPFSYHYDPVQPQRLYLHGATASRTLLHLAAGAPVSICVTLLQGLVYSRTALNHSINYRSVVCFGRGRLMESEAEKRVVFDGMISRYFAGRASGRDYEVPTLEHLNATALVEVEIEEMSAKARSGGPTGPHDSDASAQGSSGVVELGSSKCPFSGASQESKTATRADQATSATDAPAVPGYR
jgi:uncharacterized protein